MADPVPPVAVVPANSMGSTLLGALVQALTWLAFGFCFGVGLWISHPLAQKLVNC